MAIPDFQSMMLPLLHAIADGEEHVSDGYRNQVAHHFGLSAEERQTLIPSDRAPIFANRVGWVTTYLAKAGLIERPGRKRIRITARGREALRDASRFGRIDSAYLGRFPEFVEFRQRAATTNNDLPSIENAPLDEAVHIASPDDRLIASYQEIRSALAEELLDRIKLGTPRFFERVVIDLLVAMGYGGSHTDAARSVGGSGDNGIDGIIKEDKLGLDKVYIQAKRWENPVGQPVVQGFAGSLEGYRARKGVFLTTSSFTRDAMDYVDRIEKQIVLIDGEYLAQLLIDHDVGVATVDTYQIKRIDTDFFEEES
jgi:restriction system protein